MLDIYLGVLLAMATKELYFEVMGWYRRWRFKKELNDFKAFEQHLEDLEADDED